MPEASRDITMARLWVSKQNKDEELQDKNRETLSSLNKPLLKPKLNFSVGYTNQYIPPDTWAILIFWYL